MTADWREVIECPNCGYSVPTEQPIKAWIRSHRELDSVKECLCIGDSDLWIQRYGRRRWHTGVNRDVMYLMLVEIKTHDANLKKPQRELLHLANRLLRTRPWKEHRDEGRFLPGHSQNVRPVDIKVGGRKVQLYCYGAHKLSLSGSTPADSERIEWDDKSINVEQLVRILRYDLDPDSLRPVEHRSHKRKVDPPALLSMAELTRGTGVAG